MNKICIYILILKLRYNGLLLEYVDKMFPFASLNLNV